MNDKLRLNKNALREQNERLRSLLEFLPTLQLRQRQLQAALGRVRRTRERHAEAWEQRRAEIEPWMPLLQVLAPDAGPYARVEEIVTRPVDVAGVTVPELQEVRFRPQEPSLLGTPSSFDDAVTVLRDAARHRARTEVLEQQHDLLARELARTTQRINLYDEVLVPQARRNIRRLKVYLGDQRTAAVCRAKLAKTKVVARRAQLRGGDEHGHH